MGSKGTVREVDLHICPTGLDIAIAGGDTMPIVVKHITPNGNVACDGRIRVGDIIVGVNTHDFPPGTSLDEAAAALSEARGPHTEDWCKTIELPW